MQRADISTAAYRGLLCAATGAVLVLARPVWRADLASGTDLPGHLVMTRFGVDELFAHGRWDGWFPGFGSGYRLFGVNGPGMALLAGVVRAGSLGTVSAGRALVLLGILSLALLPWAVAAFSREMGSSRLAAAVHGALALLVGYHAGGGVVGLYKVGLLAHGLALPLVLVTLVLVRRAVRHGGRRYVAGAALATGFLGLLHPLSVLVVGVLGLVLSAPEVARRGAIAARRAALAALGALGLVAFWLVPAVRDRDLAGDATSWAQPPALLEQLGDVVAGRQLLPWGVGVVALVVAVAMAGWAVVEPRARAWLVGPVAAIVALVVADLAVAHGWGPFELRTQLPLRLAAVATILLLQPLAVVIAEGAQVVAGRVGVPRLVPAIGVAVGLVVVALVPWWLRGDRNPARPIEAPTAAFAAAADELADRVPPMGRHLLARPEDYAYRDGTSPDRWLAAASGTNSAHLYLWESTRAHEAGELSQRFVWEVGAAEALGQMRRFGVTHVVVTAGGQASVLRDTPGYDEVWRQDDVRIFAVARQPDLPEVGALLQPVAVPEASGTDDGDEPLDGSEGGSTASLTAVTRAQEAELVVWDVNAAGPIDVVAAVAHDPRWRVSVDGERIATQLSDEGLVQFTLPPGAHDVELRYVGRAGDRWWLAVSLLSLVVAALLAAGVPVPDRLAARFRRAPGDDPDGDDPPAGSDEPGAEAAGASPGALV
jgi:hypothetical protein